MKLIHDEKTEIFIKAFRSFLRAEGEMTIDQFTGLYKDMVPSLHRKAPTDEIDMEAFIYSLLRLPILIHKIKNVVFAQTEDIYRREGYDISFWEEVSAPARRRKMYFDAKDCLAVFINSVTDVDDLVCLLTAFQIEWNKMHAVLQSVAIDSPDTVRDTLKIPADNWDKLLTILNGDIKNYLGEIKSHQLAFKVKLLRGSFVDYKKAAQRWFENIVEHTRYKSIRTQPLYFVSSNTHSLVNNITGWATQIEDELIDYLKEQKMEVLLDYWEKINEGEHPGSKENFLWYVLKKYEKQNPEIRKKRIAFEESRGIDYIAAEHYLDVDAQVISLKELIKSDLPQKLKQDLSAFAKSDGLIINIDYPLGFGAYMVLATILHNVSQLKGMYVLGKASFLNGNLGDIGLAATILDTYSNNIYTFNNAFTKEDFTEFKAGNVLTDQKVVAAKGTFLHPMKIIQEYFLEGYSIIEMESGPYLNAIFETTYYDRYPTNDTINLINSPFDIGIIHYASDTPFSKAVTLGTRNLGYEGIEATYVSSLAILKRIIEQENKA